MSKLDLIGEIAAFADARASGNRLLIQRQHAALESLLRRLPDELPEVEQPPPPMTPAREAQA